MHYIDLQRVDGVCVSIHAGDTYEIADRAYRHAIDTADASTANVSWYFNLGHQQEHIGTRVFRSLETV